MAVNYEKQLRNAEDLFSLSRGDIVSKRNLFGLIQGSKEPGSPYWNGGDCVVGNTPQRGINWVGQFPNVRLVLIKASSGQYRDEYRQDGWTDSAPPRYRYSLQKWKGAIFDMHKANRVLIRQPEYLYPILSFVEHNVGGKAAWLCQGSFNVSGIEDESVLLSQGQHRLPESAEADDTIGYEEGERRYAMHLMAERSAAVTRELKANAEWICGVCGLDFCSTYGVEYIEAHHKVPIASYPSAYQVQASDLVLLCANCHRAVHKYMKRDDRGYEEIKDELARRFA